MSIFTRDKVYVSADRSSYVEYDAGSALMNFSVNGTKALALSTAGNVATFNAGESGRSGVVNIYPSTAAKGKLSFAAADNAGDTTTTITNASQAAARTYTIPDAGANASFVMTAGNQTIAGNKTFTGIIASSGAHLQLNSGVTSTDLAGNTVRLNSITNIGTANSLIGFQAKPAQGASMANNVIGCEISPRLEDTFALTGTASLIGAHVDAYLKGTTGDIAGDVRGMQIELVTDDAGTRTVSGDVVGLRMRAAFSGTITGDMVAFRVEKAETQTNSKQWEYLMELTGDNGLVWRDDYTTEVTTLAGAIKVLVNGQDRWIPLYSGAPVV
jgi:hypothetical protein